MPAVPDPRGTEPRATPSQLAALFRRNAAPLPIHAPAPAQEPQIRIYVERKNFQPFLRGT